MKTNLSYIILAILILAPLAFMSCGGSDGPLPDEAKVAGKSVSDFPPSRVDVAAGMDSNVALTPEEVEGRNTWMYWTGGSERFWNLMAEEGYGLVDFLYLIDSRYRYTRFERLGLINEPGMAGNDQPDEFGLYLDKVEDPLNDALDLAVYGRPTGVIGLRLFPNPEFDDKAAEKWNAERYYKDVAYAMSPDLIRPYRVGMTCAICHVGPSPTNPPANPERPAWENLSGTIANQFFLNGKVFGFYREEDDLFYHHLHSVLPGTVDTSIMATDSNNNPNIINGIFNVGERLEIAREQTVTGGALLMAPHTEKRMIPHVLVDGADTIGVEGALSRVYINIGLYSEEWIRNHNPILGGREVNPIRIEDAFEHSVYWQATVERADNLAKYLIRAGQPFPLADAPGGQEYLSGDEELLVHGKLVFAENCFACHSSKQPQQRWDYDIADFDQWSRDPDYLDWARNEVLKPDFLEENFLSTDERIPITLVKTNAARALQDNATYGGIWEDFSSVEYKETPSIGTISIKHPITFEDYPFDMPGGGPGFYRVPSLVSIWSSAPFFHNNALGLYNHDHSVEGRMEAFDDAARKLLWADQRDHLESIALTSHPSYVKFPAAHLPIVLKGKLGAGIEVFLNNPWLAPLWFLLIGLLILRITWKKQRGGIARVAGSFVGAVTLLLAVIILPLNMFAAGKLGDLKLGPIPEGTPVNLLVNLDAQNAKPTDLISAVLALNKAFRTINKEGFEGEAARAAFNDIAANKLLAVSKNPDFVRDRGHYFAEHLSDQEKEALLEFMKRF